MIAPKKKKIKPTGLILPTKEKKKSIGEEIKDLKRSKICIEDIKFGSKLGSGAQGCVKKCELNGTIYACKILPVSEDKQVRKNAMNELKSLCKFNHPQIVPLHVKLLFFN
jgi:serine/threonine protein kinase